MAINMSTTMELVHADIEQMKTSAQKRRAHHHALNTAAYANKVAIENHNMVGIVNYKSLVKPYIEYLDTHWDDTQDKIMKTTGRCLLPGDVILMEGGTTMMITIVDHKNTSKPHLVKVVGVMSGGANYTIEVPHAAAIYIENHSTGVNK